jgi:hypothetical protein
MQPSRSAASPAQRRQRSGASAAGSRLVLGLLGLALGLAGFAVWFQWDQTRRCLAFFGPAAARRIQSAPRVELWTLAAEDDVIRRSGVRDVSKAPGLVHLRRGLVEDVNYRWGPPEPAPVLREPARDRDTGADARRLAPEAWDEAFVFRDEGEAGDGMTIVAIDLDDPGRLTVVGQHGGLRLGPIGPGLRKWVEATKQAISAEKSGF